MHILENTNRFRRIERRFNSSVKDLLYQMHWLEDMKHRDIALMLNVPRSTITKWFRRFKLPTQSYRRFTDKNLTSWLYKTGQLKKKPRYEGPDRRIQRTKAGLNVDFFKKWSAEMAYVLGYFAADGCIYKNSGGSKYFNFVSTDYELLEKVKRILSSNHKIASKKQYNPNCKPAFWLQIGCKEMYNDLIRLGFLPNKETRLKFPKIPKKYLRHFIRGYFDGDGSVTHGYFFRKDRNKKHPYLQTCFAYANTEFLKQISKILSDNLGTHQGYINRDHLYYSKLDSIELFKYMYKGVSKEHYLERKYNKFKEALKILGAVA